MFLFYVLCESEKTKKKAVKVNQFDADYDAQYGKYFYHPTTGQHLGAGGFFVVAANFDDAVKYASQSDRKVLGISQLVPVEVAPIN